MTIRTFTLLLALFSTTSALANFTSRIIYPEGGRLAYVSDNEGNRIPDFSHAGYKGGGVPLPTVPTVITLSPIAGDNSVHIQTAINQVGAMPMDANGIRGAVTLAPGNYPIENRITIPHSGVVLRGSGAGADPAHNSIIRAARSMRGIVLVVGGNLSNWTPAANVASFEITSDFVPVGSRSVEVTGTPVRSFAVGDNIVIRHPSTPEWLNAINGGDTASGDPWSPGAEDIYFNRTITAIVGRTITFDAPLYNHLDRSLSPSYLYRVNRNGLVTEVGVEDLRIHIETAGATDEAHAESALFFHGVENGWARNVTTRHFLLTGIGTQSSTFITVKDCRALDPHSIITGARRYPFNTLRFSNNILFDNCYANDGRHCFVSNGTSSVSGIVFYNSISHRAFAASEGHRRWSQGMLFDNLTFTSPNTNIVIGFYNRGDFGTSHGWSAVHSVAWNCDPGGRNIVIQKPPTGQNYGIGNRPNVNGSGPFSQPTGYIEGTSQLPLPSSLYQAQLAERLAFGVAPDAPVWPVAVRSGGDLVFRWEHISAEANVHFLVERSVDLGQTWQQVATLAAPISAYIDSGLASGTYQYRVRASGQGGLSAYSPPATAAIPGLGLDFEDETAGEKPTNVTRLRPSGANVGQTLTFPIQSAENGPMGVVVIGPDSSPVASTQGKSVRIYDYSTNDKAKLSRLFVPDEESAFSQVRFDFSFRRSVAMQNQTATGQGLLLGLGAPSTAETMRLNAGYALTLQLYNDGTIRVSAKNTPPAQPFEPFDTMDDHRVSIFANAQPEPFTYIGPDWEERTLDGYRFSVFLNGQFLAENAFRENPDGTPTIPVLGKLAFTTGQGNPNTHIDFVIDDIQISDFSIPPERPIPPVLRIETGNTEETVRLSWESAADSTYSLDRSVDLLNWQPTGAIFTGDGGVLQYLTPTAGAERAFYRLVSPANLTPPPLVSTPAAFTSSHQVRLWTNNTVTPSLQGTTQYGTFASSQIGKSGPTGEQRLLNPIHGFQLPPLDGPPTEATYTLTKTGQRGPPDWSAQLYLFAPPVNPPTENPTDIFWSDPAGDNRAPVRPITLTAIDSSTAEGELTFTLNTTDLAGFYDAAGTPISADGMIWFRLNPGEIPEAISNFERLELQSLPDRIDSPTLLLSRPH